MNTAIQNHEVVVIGGGIAGLATSIFLSRQGKRVVLLERSKDLGGRAQTEVFDGFSFNLGPHALYRGSAGIKILRELGVEPVGAIPTTSGQFAIKDWRKHTLPTGFLSLLTTDLFSLAEKIEVARFLASLSKIRTELITTVPLNVWLEEKVSQDNVKDFVRAAIRVATYTNAPDLISAGAAIHQLKLAFAESVLYLDHGWQTLVDALIQNAVQAGVTIRIDSAVKSIERNNKGEVSSVHLTNGEIIRSRVVVLASDPSTAVKLLGDDARTSLHRFLSNNVKVEAACLDVALDRLPYPNAKFALSIDRPMYLSVHSATARLAPEGGAMIHIARYLDPNAEENPDADRQELTRLLDLVQPGWSALVRHQRFLPRLTVANAMAAAKINGTLGRPEPEVHDVPGLYIVGDWVGSEGMLADAALASAKQAAQLIGGRRPASLAIAS